MPDLNFNAFRPFVPRVKHFRNLTGQNFNRLAVVSIFNKSPTSTVAWLCRCSCGVFCVVTAGHLRSGHTKSCGCHKLEQARRQFYKHGEAINGSESPELKAFNHAKGRCTNPNDKAFANYGGRGIRFRFESFDTFITELGHKPTAKHSLDRINVNGHYEAGNVRWATRLRQSWNMRTNKTVTLGDETKCIGEWSNETGISDAAIRRRIANGWCPSCTLQTFRGRGHCPHKLKS